MSGYIGTQPVPQATQTRDSFTATSGQVSFSCSGYTPNFLDVFLNGVKLAAADYTATNGSDVVLASGAATGDILEVVAFTTFNSASSSIDDNGNATAITIDSNNNVGIGTTPSATYSAFDTIEFETASIISQNTATGGASPDGNLVLGSNMNYSSGGGPEYKVTGKSTQITQIDGNITLGVATSGTANTNITYNTGLEVLNDGYARAKNGLLFGTDTAAANALDDYEEGTWTPSLGGNAQYNIQAGTYTKVGSIVQIYMELRPTTLGTGSTTQISGLPFSVVTDASAGIDVSYYDGAATNIYTLNGIAQSTAINLYGRTSAVNYAGQAPAFFQNNARLYLSATYRTNA